MRSPIVPASPATRSSRASGLISQTVLVQRFLRDDDGSVSIAYVLWFGLFASIFTVMADVTFLFMANSEMWHVAHDAARRLSVADMSELETEAYARAAIADFFGDSATVVARQTGDAVEISITAPYEAVTVFGIYDRLDSGTLSARVLMRNEVAAIAMIEGGISQSVDVGAMVDG